MNGRRMLWTTLFGTSIALMARLINRRRTPVRRMFRRFGRRKQTQWWMRLAQPMVQMGRRMAR